MFMFVKYIVFSQIISLNNFAKLLIGVRIFPPKLNKLKVYQIFITLLEGPKNDLIETPPWIRTIKGMCGVMRADVVYI